MAEDTSASVPKRWSGPPKSPDRCEAQAGLILLAVLAAQAAAHPDVIVARLLRAIGWASGDGTELTERAAGHASWSTMAALRQLGALTDDGPRHRATKLTRDGVTFARAALYSWPQR